MSPPESAAPRIGCVSYLNSKPLIHGHAKGISFETPASLADGLRTTRLDVALAPIFELILHPGYLVADDVAIASNGPVYSVVIAYHGELVDLQKLYLDPASRTSVHLQRILLAEFYGLAPATELLPPGHAPETLQPGEGALLIGDLAIDFRLHNGGLFQYLDLGEVWRRNTGLPFVYAAWLMHPGVASPLALGDQLRSWRNAGLAALPHIVEDETRYPAALTQRYLSEHIRYQLGPAEKKGIREYARLLGKYRLVPAAPFVEPRWT